ncbi:MAG: LysR family transcriptional regulator [Gammaproteobacteria bacterium]|nr:LysR family transcriptional regulator [Gammaproteobacteria bacterium]
MNINYKQIEAFVWVADLGNFRQAAERLNTTQPNISTRVANLEQAIGAPLFERSAGAISMTRRGKELLESARDVVKSAERFEAQAGLLHLSNRTIRLGVTEMIVSTWLPIFLKQVKQQFPNLNLELTVDLSVNLKPDLFSRALDITFQNGPFSRTTTGTNDLGSFPFQWVASRDLAVSQATELSFDDMQAQTILVHSRDTLQFQEIEQHFTQKNSHRPTIVPSSSIAPCIHMCVQGMGVSAIPLVMAKRYFEQGDLVPLNYPWAPAPLEFLARYDANTSPKVVGDLAELAQHTVSNYIAETC